MTSIQEIASKYFPGTEPCRCGGAHSICLNCAKCRADEPDELYTPGDPIASIIDATVLKADATDDDIRALCATANEHDTASVCVNSHFVPLVKKLLTDSVKSCTVINFPLGANSRKAVKKEAKAVIEAGIDELDMVQNIAALRSGDWQMALETIKSVAIQCLENSVLLKVILETCYLSRDEIILSCLLAKKAGAKFVKTSTGFGSAGATAENIALMREVVGPKLGVKASGGIRDKASAQSMIEAGANRIGASSVTALI